MKSIKHVLGLGLVISVLLLSHSVRSELFPLSIIHINDFHARFEATDTAGGTCDEGEECIGGYARTVHTVRRLLDEQKEYNPLYFNAGDSFQGTLWYNVGRWNVTSEFLNILPADAMTLGNHEFDHKIEGLVPFLRAIESPMLVANIDAADEPDMEGLFEKSMIIERSGRKIGVIGVVLETFYDLADTGKLKFLNESDAITTEAQILKEQGANIIIVLTHCGYDVDKIIAQNAGADIDVIIGSHSHTFLYTGEVMPGPDKARGDYPTEIIHEDSGHRVLIVQAGAYAKYVGNITVFFDDNGDIVSWEGAPIYMAKEIEEDEVVKSAMVPWKQVIDVMGNEIVGISRVTLEKWPCSSKECNLGNFFADAMVHSFVDISPYDRKPWSNVSIGLVNAGALRVPLYKGNLTYAHVVAMSPFENTLVAFNLQGKYLLDVLEYSVKQVNISNGINSSPVMLQVSGLRITYNFTKPMGERVHDVQVKCTDCDFPIFEPLDQAKVYRIVAPDYLANGGDGFYILPAQGTDFEPHVTDIEALIDYMSIIQPITTANEDQFVLRALKPWTEEVDKIGSKVVGETAVKLEKFECSSRECNLGNFFTDAMVHAFVKSTPYTATTWSTVAIALTTQGNFRVPLEKGTLTYSHLYTMCPFENEFIAVDMYGRHLVEVLEVGVRAMNSSLQTPTSSRLLQVSGLKVTYNVTNNPGHRVDSVMVRCNRCEMPIYERLDPDTIYRLVVSDYLAEGNNGFGVIKENAFNLEVGPKDLDAVIEYIEDVRPVVAVLEGRVNIVK